MIARAATATLAEIRPCQRAIHERLADIQPGYEALLHRRNAEYNRGEFAAAVATQAEADAIGAEIDQLRATLHGLQYRESAMAERAALLALWTLRVDAGRAADAAAAAWQAGRDGGEPLDAATLALEAEALRLADAFAAAHRLAHARGAAGAADIPPLESPASIAAGRTMVGRLADLPPAGNVASIRQLRRSAP
jgi:hypothetical protein